LYQWIRLKDEEQVSHEAKHQHQPPLVEHLM
jgi:hypothetical protein